MFAKNNDEDLFDNNSRRMYPDFYRKDYILDAKYKHLNGTVGREDLYQVISYMYCMKAEFGGYIYPDEWNNSIATYKLTGFGKDYNPEDSGGILRVIPFKVPQNQQDWQDFITNIEVEEKKLIESLPKEC